jgi:3-dehydrosphinganine reductase
MMEVNYYGALYVTKAFLPGLIARRSGHIVNVVSTAGFVGIFGYSAYSASKFALRGFSDSLRVEMKSLGIQVSLVCPSDTDTPQYAYEHPLRPVELEGMFSAIGMKPIPAEIVASRILNGIAKKKPIIIPDAETGALFFLINHFGNLAYPIQDLLLAYSRKKAGGKRYQSASSENQPE